MKFTGFSGAIALAVLLMPALAVADDPNDPAMRSPAARARDHEMIRQLNLGQLAKVRARDAGYAEGWAQYRDGGSGGGQSSSNADYARARSDYERQMADWRYAVAACKAGDYSACGG